MPRTTSIEYFRLFFETAQAILSSPALQPTLDALVAKTVGALQVKAASLRLIDEQSGVLELVASHGLSRSYLDKGALSADRSIPEVLEGKVVCIKDAFNDPRIQYQMAMRNEGINTVLSVPVIADKNVIGVLRLYSAVPRAFNASDIEFVAAIAELGGLAIANARLYEADGSKLTALFRDIGVEIPAQSVLPGEPLQAFAPKPLDKEKSLAYFRTLHDIIRTILSARDSRQVMQLIVDQVIGILQIKACALRLINETTHELELLAACGLSERFLGKGPPHADRSIHETLAGMPVLIVDTSSDPRLEYPAETVAEGIASILSLPIIARRRVVGVLRLYSAQPRSFSQEEVAFSSAVAEIAGIAIMNARLHEKTKYDLAFWTATMGYLREESN